MSKDCQCTVCRKPMGTVRDATLRKGWAIICAECNQRRLELLVELSDIKRGGNHIEQILRAAGVNI